MATKAQIVSVIKKQLASFNQNKVEINNDTELDSVFNNPNEFSKRNPDLFKSMILWTLNFNKHKPSSGGKNKFPSNWRSLTVTSLAEKLFMILAFVMIGFTANSQLRVNAGSVKTDLRQNALNFGFSYIRSLDSAYGGEDVFVTGKRSALLITPDIEFRTGTEDAFNGIIAKASGLLSRFQTTTVDGLVTPNADKFVSVFPMSLGVETNNQFSFVNALAEVGFEPYYHSPLNVAPDWVKRTKFGVFLQAGHKFSTGQDSVNIGGAADESFEQVGSTIFRAKGNAMIDTRKLVSVGGLDFGLVGSATGWYDFLNQKIYHRLEGTARIFLSDQTYLDFNYIKGSGAPNFNQGSQWGVGLTINY